MSCSHGVGASVCKHCEGLDELRRELEEWRSGKRRVFWRVRGHSWGRSEWCAELPKSDALDERWVDLETVSRAHARKYLSSCCSKSNNKRHWITRVTKRPKGAKR